MACQGMQKELKKRRGLHFADLKLPLNKDLGAKTLMRNEDIKRELSFCTDQDTLKSLSSSQNADSKKLVKIAEVLSNVSITEENAGQVLPLLLSLIDSTKLDILMLTLPVICKLLDDDINGLWIRKLLGRGFLESVLKAINANRNGQLVVRCGLFIASVLTSLENQASSDNVTATLDGTILLIYLNKNDQICRKLALNLMMNICNGPSQVEWMMKNLVIQIFLAKICSGVGKTDKREKADFIMSIINCASIDQIEKMIHHYHLIDIICKKIAEEEYKKTFIQCLLSICDKVPSAEDFVQDGLLLGDTEHVIISVIEMEKNKTRRMKLGSLLHEDKRLTLKELEGEEEGEEKFEEKDKEDEEDEEEDKEKEDEEDEEEDDEEDEEEDGVAETAKVDYLSMPTLEELQDGTWMKKWMKKTMKTMKKTE